MFVLANGHLSISHATVHLAFYDVSSQPLNRFLGVEAVMQCESRWRSPCPEVCCFCWLFSLKKLTDFGSKSNMIIFLKRLVTFPPFFVSFWVVNMAFWRIIWRRLIFNVNSHDYVLRSYWLLYSEDARFTGTHAGWSIFF